MILIGDHLEGMGIINNYDYDVFWSAGGGRGREGHNFWKWSLGAPNESMECGLFCRSRP